MIDTVLKNLPLIMPLIILQLILMITALIHVLRHPAVRIGNKTLWIIIIVFVNIIGPILYFLVGRCEE